VPTWRFDSGRHQGALVQWLGNGLGLSIVIRQRSPHDFEMMTAAECRAKAQEAIKRADAITDIVIAARFQETARDWAALAVMVDAMEVLLQNLAAKTLD
jgi:hypothetical protein